jgi:hypothetical protein
MGLVCDTEEDADICGEPACIRDPYADEQAGDSDDDLE